MRFGDLPPWAQQVSASVLAAGLLPDPLAARRPLFDQLILNQYTPGQGIAPHADLLRFEVSLRVPDASKVSALHICQLWPLLLCMFVSFGLSCYVNLIACLYRSS